MGDEGITEGNVLGIAPGDLIGGRYEIVRVLGVGGTGAVFEARHRAIGRTVAIKLLLPELAHNPLVPTRFLQEARTANQVRHRNIVEVMDFGDDKGRLYLVMEYLKGESLAAFIKREAPIAPGRILKIMDPIFAALSAAHAQGIIHRDVKPQNLFLAEGSDGEIVPKLIDFGIAKRIVSEDVNLTATGMILGTPAYMAPEQAQGERNVTGATDQYALGAILYQALTGKCPLVADTYPAMLIALVTQKPRDIAELRPDMDPGIGRAVMTMLEREPAARYSSIDAARAAFKPFLESHAGAGIRLDTAHPTLDEGRTRPDGTPAHSHVPAPIPVGTRGGTAPVPEHLPLPHPHPSGQTSVAPIVGAGVFVVAAMSVAAILALRTPSPTPPVLHNTDPTTTAHPTVDTVTFRVDVDPPAAEITLDGVVVGHGHAELLRPRDGHRYQLRLSYPGHGDVTDVLVASTDARVSRVLPNLAPPSSTSLNSNVAQGGQNGHVLLHPNGPVTPTSPPSTTDPVLRTDARHPRIDRHNPFNP